jgi:hypothetical protein
MKPRKPKSAEPSLLDKLSMNFLAAFERDFETHGVDVIEKLRERSPEKYAELVARLIATTEPKKDGFESANSMEELGRKLLLSVKAPDDAITAQMIADTIEANDAFIAKLEAIRDSAQGN